MMRDDLTPSVSTRPARDSDKAIIWQLYEEALRHHIETIWGWEDEWQRTYLDEAFLVSSTQVIDVDGRVAGYLQVDKGADEDYLRMLILDPAARSRRVGARLLSAILADSRAGGRGLYLRVFRTNTSARRFYEREGWAVVADEGDFLLMRPRTE
jgi:ribosomal protein S18 acetylase RimI-like enzyme